MASQIELYERLTDTKLDLGDVAAVTEPFIFRSASAACASSAAQARADEVWAAIGNCLIVS